MDFNASNTETYTTAIQRWGTCFLYQYSKFNAENVEKFHELIENENWDNVYTESDTQLKYTKFLDTYTKLYNTAFPKSSTRRKNSRKNPKPWILPWLEDACSRKNKLYHAFVKNPTVENKLKYTNMNKFVKKQMQLAKNKFYKKYFEQHKSNSRKQWQMLNSLLNRNKYKSTKFRLLDEHGSKITEPLQIAETFNIYLQHCRKLEAKTRPFLQPYIKL